MNDDDRPVYPKVAFSRARRAYPELNSELNDAEWELGVAEALLDHKFHRLLCEPFLPDTDGRLLSGRMKLIGTLAVERGLSLAEGIAAEIEGNRLYAAGSIARSLMELVGLMVLVHDRIVNLREQELPDIARLDSETMRFLVASRSMPALDAPPMIRTREMINAARERYGDAFGDDYGFLSDMAHPNASGAFGMEFLSQSARFAVLRRPPISTANAELLLKVLSVGMHSVVHDALLLIEWAADHDLVLKDSG